MKPLKNQQHKFSFYLESLFENIRSHNLTPSTPETKWRQHTYFFLGSMYEEHSINRCGETMREDGSQPSKPKGYMYWSYKNCTKNQVKDAWKYHAGYATEKPCIGGHGSKPAFDLLRGMPDVKIKRGYSIYVGHVGFDVYTKTKNDMRKALKELHTVYHWIGDDDASKMLDGFVDHNPQGFYV